MKLKALAVAALAAVSLPTFAAIDVQDNGELVLFVWDATGSYSLDTGLLMNDVLAASSSTGGYTKSFTVAGTTGWSSITLSPNTKWALVGVSDTANPFGTATTGGNRLVSTLGPGQTFANNDGDSWLIQVQGLAQDRLRSVNATGTHATAANGSSFAPVGTAAYFPPYDVLGSQNFNMGNAVGTNSFVALTARSDEFDGTLNIAGSFLGNAAGRGVASFDGATLTYTVAAVPEPGSVAMLLAGLGVLGFTGARRRRT